MRNQVYDIDYKPIKQIKRELQALTQIDFNSISFEDYFGICQACFSGVTFPLLSFYSDVRPKTHVGFGIFRARKWNSTLPKSTDELWEPPPSKVHKLGRCNLINDSMFYGANHFTTAIIESRAKEGEQWFVTEFDIVKMGCLQLSVLGMRKQKVLKQAQNNAQGFYESFPEINKKRNQMIDDHFHRCFRKSFPDGSNLYMETVGIAKFLLGSPSTKEIIHGLSYPSVASGLVGLNFAIKPEVARRLIFPVRTYALKINQLDLANSLINVQFQYLGEVLGSSILWSKSSRNPLL